MSDPDLMPSKDTKTLQLWFDHGLGDVCQFAAILQLYRRRGFDLTVHYEGNKAAVWEAAGCSYFNRPLNYHNWKYHPGFNKPVPHVDGSGNKAYLNLNTETLPDLGDRDQVWEELCALDLEDLGVQVVTDEQRAEAERFVKDLPRPIVLLHTRGTNFANEKSIPDHVVNDIYKQLLDETGAGLVLLDWDNRVPRPPHGRIRHTKRDWGHISTHQLMALMGVADLLIGIDSGPFHLANWTKLPALGIFTGFYPTCVTLPRVSGRNVVMTQGHNRNLNIRRRKRWNVVEYAGGLPNHKRAGSPSAEDVVRHAVRMLAGPRYGCPIGRDVAIQQWVRDWLRSGTSTSPIADRQNTMDWLFREITTRFPDPTIVETGCVRSAEDWSAGYSTYLFGAYLDGRRCGSLTSVDINPGNCKTARDLCRDWSERLTVVESCSVAYLSERTDPVDVLFLDSLDCEDARHSAHGLAEIQAAERLLSDSSLVVFDDTVYAAGWKGKGAEAVPYLLGRGWSVLASGYQTIMGKVVADVG
jgi:ADP-heptose:LPS heptosyltransferase